MKQEKEEQIMCVLPGEIRLLLKNYAPDFSKLQEIRLREGQPAAIRYGGKEQFFRHQITRDEIREAMEYIANYSLYAYEHEMKQGFLTIEGGHRVGIAGKIILEDGHVRNFQYISSINIRVCHEVIGCADTVFPGVLEGGRLCHTMIISPPGCGKTTLLRDMVRQISDGNSCIKGMNVGVVDERSEIAGCYQGKAQNHVGKRTDILDNCPKAEGMMMMIRSMSPQVLVVDEIGSERDVEAVSYAMHCGAIMLVTVHGTSLEEIREKPLMRRFWDNRYFGRYIVLSGEEKIGKIRGIYDERGRTRCI